MPKYLIKREVPGAGKLPLGRTIVRVLSLVSASVLIASAASAQTGSAEHSAPAIKWGPVPPVLPSGAQIAVLQGNPFAKGVYTLRLKMPAGYVVPPHFHPTDEMVTVISGEVFFDHGDSVNKKTATLMHAGGFVTAASGEHHYIVARGPVVVQVHGEGPFAITYVHPQDDPQNKLKK